MSERLMKQLADDLGGKVEIVGRAPDGSGFAVMSYPLPKDHWSCVDPDGFNVPPMPLRLGTNASNHQEMCNAIRAAGKYAYRCATMNGKEPDLDPDALIQNLIVGLIGYHTPDGLSADDFANPPVWPLDPRGPGSSAATQEGT